MKSILFILATFYSVAYGQFNTPHENTSYDYQQLIGFPHHSYNIAFDDSLSLVRKHHKYGIVNSKRKEIVPVIYDEIDIDFSIRKTINLQLKTLNEFYYMYWEDGGESETLFEELTAIEKRNPRSYLNLANAFKSNPVFAAKKDGKYGAINTSNEIIIPFQYDVVKDIGQDIFLVKSNGKFGIITAKNEVLVPVSCDTIMIYPFYSEVIFEPYKLGDLAEPGSFAVLKQGNKYGGINLFSNKVVLPVYDSLEICSPIPEHECKCGFTYEALRSLNTRTPSRDVHSFQHLLKFKTGGKLGLLNVVSMQEIVSPVYDRIDFKANHTLSLDGQSVLLLNNKSVLDITSYDTVYPIITDYPSGMLVGSSKKKLFYTVKKGNKAGLMDDSGAFITKIAWDSIISVVPLKNTNEYAILVQRNGKIGVIDGHNQLIIPLKNQTILLQKEIDSDFHLNYYYSVHRRGKSTTLKL
ncbi:MAG: WG repeat-containing protein [Fluviicola sp.]